MSPRSPGVLVPGALAAAAAWAAAAVADTVGTFGHDSSRLGISPLRLHLLAFSSFVGGYELPLLLLVAAVGILGVRFAAPLALIVFVAAVVFASVAVLGALNILFLGYAPVGARIGAALQELAWVPPLAVAALLTRSAEPVPDPPGEAPDRRLG